jgi:hypothetical protein
MTSTFISTGELVSDTGFMRPFLYSKGVAILFEAHEREALTTMILAALRSDVPVQPHHECRGKTHEALNDYDAFIGKTEEADPLLGLHRLKASSSRSTSAVPATLRVLGGQTTSLRVGLTAADDRHRSTGNRR